jgi:hypothetical protein
VYGLIKAYDPETQTGTITIGKENFQFEIKDWVADAPPEYGDEVVFELRGVKPFNINLRGALLNNSEAVKSRYIAIALAFFLGWAGIHRFYLGYYRVGITQIIVNGLLVVAGLMGYAVLWGFVESFLLFSGHLDKDAEGRPLK